jgi:hypothetical protein
MATVHSRITIGIHSLMTELIATTHSCCALANHGHVLLVIALDPEVRGRDIETGIGVTEGVPRTTIADLTLAGYVERKHRGRRRAYYAPSLRHQTAVGELLKVLATFETLSVASSQDSLAT